MGSRKDPQRIGEQHITLPPLSLLYLSLCQSHNLQGCLPESPLPFPTSSPLLTEDRGFFLSRVAFLTCPLSKLCEETKAGTISLSCLVHNGNNSGLSTSSRMLLNEGHRSMLNSVKQYENAQVSLFLLLTHLSQFISAKCWGQKLDIFSPYRAFYPEGAKDVFKCSPT